MRKAITGLAIVALVVGVALVAISLSQEPSALARETENEVFYQPLEGLLDDLVEDEVITEEQRDRIAEALRDRLVRFGKGFPGTHHLETVAEILDMDGDELAAQLRGGSTIAEIAGERTQAVIDALVAEHTARIDRAIDEGKLTEDEADAVRATLVEKIEAMVNGEHPTRSFGGFSGPHRFDFFHGPFGGGSGFDIIAAALGMEVEELRDQLSRGWSLADIAEAQGVDAGDIVDAVLANLDGKLADLVADGRLTEERADAIREDLAASIESMISGDMPEFGDFDAGEGFPHFRGPGFDFPKDFFGDGGGFFRFPAPHEGFPDCFGNPDGRDHDEFLGTGTSV